jgi:hypothetical protein
MRSVEQGDRIFAATHADIGGKESRIPGETNDDATSLRRRPLWLQRAQGSRKSESHLRIDVREVGGTTTD